VIPPSDCNLVPLVMQLTASQTIIYTCDDMYDKMLSFDLTIFGITVCDTPM